MSNQFAYDNGTVLDAPLSAEGSTDSVGPPVVVLTIAIFGVLLQLLFFAPGDPTWHWVGYALGCVIIPVTVFVYRRIDHQRQGTGMYGTRSGVKLLPIPILVAGVLLAVIHAYYLAIHKRLS